MRGESKTWLRGLAVSLGLVGLLAGAAWYGRYRMQERMRENEVAAVQFLGKTLPRAQSLFREGDLEGDGVLDYARNLDELIAAGLIPAELDDGRRNGYSFELRQGEHPEFTWIAVASPSSPGVSGERHFAVNHAGTVAMSPTPIPLTASASLPANVIRLCNCGDHKKP